MSIPLTFKLTNQLRNQFLSFGFKEVLFLSILKTYRQKGFTQHLHKVFRKIEQLMIVLGEHFN